MTELNPADLAAALAHRACTGTEHDPQNGKLHGCCVVCGHGWPCDTAEFFLRKLPKDPDPQWTPEQMTAAIRAAPWVPKQPVINMIPPPEEPLTNAECDAALAEFELCDWLGFTRADVRVLYATVTSCRISRGSSLLPTVVPDSVLTDAGALPGQ